MVRSVHPDEEKSAQRLFEAFEEGMWERIKSLGEVRIIQREKEKALVLASKDIVRAYAPLDPLHLGTELGTYEGFDVRLSIEGVLLLAGLTEKRTVVIAEKGEQLFLYGRDLFGPSVLKHDKDLKPGMLCIVRNNRGECIGLGRVTGPFRTESTCVKNVLDLGSYLRDDQE